MNIVKKCKKYSQISKNLTQRKINVNMLKFNIINKAFNELKVDQENQNKLSKYYEDMLTTTSAVEAFHWSMMKNFNPIPEKWTERITATKAGEFMNEKKIMSRNTFLSYVKKGFFRQDENKKVYLDEVEKFFEAYEVVNQLFKSKILSVEKEGKSSKIYLYPTQITKLNLSNIDQALKSAIKTTKTQWFTDMGNFMDLS